MQTRIAALLHQGSVDACDYAALRTWGARAAVKRALLA